MRWCSIAWVSLAGCTTANPEFGLETNGSSGTDPGTVTSSTSTSASTTTSADASSSESGGAPSCGEPDDRFTRITVIGPAVGAGATHGAIRRTQLGLEVDCTDPCAADVPLGCLAVGFEIDPPLWNGWEPPGGCFRFQWLGNDLASVDELRVGIEGESDELTVLGAEPLFAKTYDVELISPKHCSCHDRECCPMDAGEYDMLVHGPVDVVLTEGMSEQGNVEWMSASYRVENAGSSIVPDCDAPKRVQFRAYQNH